MLTKTIPLNHNRYIALKLLNQADRKKSISKPIVRIALGGITLGTVVMILTLAIVKGFQSEIRNKMVGVNGHVILSRFDNDNSLEPLPIRSDLPEYKTIKNKKDIKKIQVFAYKNGIIKTEKENEGVILKGVGEDFDWSFIKNHLIEGETFSVKNDSVGKNILISSKQSKRLGIKTGDKMIVYFVNKKNIDSLNYTYEQRSRSFKVCGIYETGLEEIDASTSFIDIKHIQKLNYWNSNEVAGYEIFINDLEKLDQLTDEINEECSLGLTAESVKTKNPGIFGWLELMDSNAVIIISLMIAVAGINMISALLIMILEKTKTIGILKAIGASNPYIRNIFINQASLLIGKGILYGNIIGLLICFLQWKFKWITLNQESYYISHVPILLDWYSLIWLNLLTITCCLSMMLLPTMAISKITPVKAIRFS